MAESGNETQRAILDELVVAGESWCVAEDVVAQSVAVIAKQKDLQDNEVVPEDMKIVVGFLKNLTNGPLDLDQADHTGYMVKDFPNPLTADLGSFIQASYQSEEVGGLVVYKGKNRGGELCYWLLAWLDSETDGLKIYAECGPEYKFKKLDHVKPKFEDKSAIVYFHDPETGTTVAGKIDSSNGKDLLVAFFDG